jgi:flagellar basal body P-ring protein FlgI
MNLKLQLVSAFLLLVPAPQFALGEQTRAYVQIRDLTTIEGVRENPLIGYGMVVGLAGTGDRRQTMFSTQTLETHPGTRVFERKISVT